MDPLAGHMRPACRVFETAAAYPYIIHLTSILLSRKSFSRYLADVPFFKNQPKIYLFIIYFNINQYINTLI